MKIPPDGEFPIMNYRMTQEFKPPFKVYPVIEEAGPFKAEVVLKVRADFPTTITANMVTLRVPLPKTTTRVSFDLETGAVGQTTDFKEANKVLEWCCRKIVGGSEHTLRAKLTLSQERNGRHSYTLACRLFDLVLACNCLLIWLGETLHLRKSSRAQ
jgi:AP-4 complex subunit mu-1